MRFPVLSIIGVTLRVLGWLAVVAGVLGFILSVIALLNHGDQSQYQYQQYYQYAQQLAMIAPLIASAYTVLVGLVLVAWGESVLVLLAIEENTRNTPLQPATQILQLLVAIELNTRPAITPAAGESGSVDAKA